MSTGAAVAVGAGMTLTTVLPASADDEEQWDRIALDVLQEIETHDPTVELEEPYDRDDGGWGGWSDPDGNGCNTMRDIRIRDTIPETQVFEEDDDCELEYGEAYDPFDNEHIVQDKSLEDDYRTPFQIDHVVSLSDAHRSGGHEWTEEERGEFSQDTENLVASYAGTNVAKSDNRIHEWLPPEELQHCEYASTVVYVKDKYDLTMTPDEHEAAENILETDDCAETVASPAITLTHNYQEAQAEQGDDETEEPTEEPTDEPTEEPSETPTEDSTVDPTEENTPSETPSLTTSFSATSAPSTLETEVAIPDDPEPLTQEEQDYRPDPIVVEDGLDGEGSDGDASINGFPVDDDTVLSDAEREALEESGVSIDTNDPAVEDLTDEELESLSDEDIERLADAGPGDWTTWASIGSLAAIGLGAFFMWRGRPTARKH